MPCAYTPLRYEMIVVETLRNLPVDSTDLQKLKDKLEAKYEAEVTIEKHDFDKSEWSWRTDSSYTVNCTEYLVKCIQPVYSDDDVRAMNKEASEAAMAEFRAKYGGKSWNFKRKP